MKVRAATIADVITLHGLVERAYRGDSARKGWTHEADLLGGQRTDVESLSEIITDPNQRILLAFHADVLAGCVQISIKANQIAYLGLLSVDPERQAGGLGRMLIAAAEVAAVSEFGAHAMEMTVIRQRAELIAYYERRGYALTGEERPFPHGDEQFGLPVTSELSFVVLAKPL
jgi:predicted N-acetyltransferase YhbS